MSTTRPTGEGIAAEVRDRRSRFGKIAVLVDDSEEGELRAAREFYGTPRLPEWWVLAGDVETAVEALDAIAAELDRESEDALGWPCLVVLDRRLPILRGDQPVDIESASVWPRAAGGAYHDPDDAKRAQLLESLRDHVRQWRAEESRAARGIDTRWLTGRQARRSAKPAGLGPPIEHPFLLFATSFPRRAGRGGPPDTEADNAFPWLPRSREPLYRLRIQVARTAALEAQGIDPDDWHPTVEDRNEARRIGSLLRFGPSEAIGRHFAGGRPAPPSDSADLARNPAALVRELRALSPFDTPQRVPSDVPAAPLRQLAEAMATKRRGNRDRCLLLTGAGMSIVTDSRHSGIPSNDWLLAEAAWRTLEKAAVAARKKSPDASDENSGVSGLVRPNWRSQRRDPWRDSEFEGRPSDPTELPKWIKAIQGRIKAGGLAGENLGAPTAEQKPGQPTSWREPWEHTSSPVLSVLRQFVWNRGRISLRGMPFNRLFAPSLDPDGAARSERLQADFRDALRLATLRFDHGTTHQHWLAAGLPWDYIVTVNFDGFHERAAALRAHSTPRPIEADRLLSGGTRVGEGPPGPHGSVGRAKGGVAPRLVKVYGSLLDAETLALTQADFTRRLSRLRSLFDVLAYAEMNVGREPSKADRDAGPAVLSLVVAGFSMADEDFAKHLQQLIKLLVERGVRVRVYWVAPNAGLLWGGLLESSERARMIGDVASDRGVSRQSRSKLRGDLERGLRDVNEAEKRTVSPQEFEAELEALTSRAERLWPMSRAWSRAFIESLDSGLFPKKKSDGPPLPDPDAPLVFVPITSTAQAFFHDLDLEFAALSKVQPEPREGSPLTREPPHTA